MAEQPTHVLERVADSNLSETPPPKRSKVSGTPGLDESRAAEQAEIERARDEEYRVWAALVKLLVQPANNAPIHGRGDSRS